MECIALVVFHFYAIQSLEIYSDIYLHGCQWISQLIDLDDTLQILKNDEFDFAFENRINLFVFVQLAQVCYQNRVPLHGKVIYFKVTRSIFSLMSNAEYGSSVYSLFVAIFNNIKIDQRKSGQNKNGTK